MSTATRGLPDFPVEILRLICLYLTPDANAPFVSPSDSEEASERWISQQVLTRLSQTCSTLRDVAQPELFRTVTLHERKGLTFLLAILDRPALARSVQRIRFHDMVTLKPLTAQSEQFSRKLREEPPCLGTAIHTLHVDDSDIWHSLLQSDNEDGCWAAVLALHLAFLPCLKELRLPWSSDTSLALSQLRFPSAKWVRSWETLEQLTVRQSHDFNSVEMPRFGLAAGILAWPNLRYLRLEGCTHISLSELGPLPTSAIKHFGLQDCIMSEGVRQALINHCNGLETFEFVNNCSSEELDGPTDPEDSPLSYCGPDTPVYPEELLAELRVHHETLKTLKLDLSGVAGYERHFGGYIPPGCSPNARFLSSLHDFTSLQVLEINHEVLREASEDSEGTGMSLAGLLPKSICKLKLTGMSHHLPPILHPLAIEIADFPSLTQIEVQEAPYSDPAPAEFYFPYAQRSRAGPAAVTVSVTRPGCSSAYNR